MSDPSELRGMESTDATSLPADPEKRPIRAFTSTEVPQGLINISSIIWRLALVVLAVFGVLWLIGLLGGVAIAMFFAGLIAALGMPVQRFLGRIMPNVLATILTLLFMFVLVSVVLAFVVTSIIQQAPAVVAAANAGLQEIQNWLRGEPFNLDDTAMTSLVEKAEQSLTSAAETLAASLASFAGGIGDFITAFAVFIFAAFFFINSGAAIWKWILTWVPERVREETDNCGHAAWTSLSGYTRGIVLVAIADGILVYIGLVILNVPLAPALAVVVMFGALIPVIGAPIATLFAAVVALASEGLVTALLVVALTVVVGSFDGDIMQPLIMGHAVSLHPLAIVSVIAFGTMTFGIIGAFVAVPLTATVYSVAKYLTGRMPPPKETEKVPRKPRMPHPIRRLRKKRAAQLAEPATAVPA